MRLEQNNYTLMFIIFLLGLLLGFAIHRTKIFPYRLIVRTYYSIAGRFFSQWSIGIYEGLNPFSLQNPEIISNPVLSYRDIRDVEASFVADPFMIIHEWKYYLFFEVMNKESGKGEVAYAESNDCIKWTYKKRIISERFHLSYPSVFEWEGNYYLIPESSEDFSVRLYKASDFPEKWEYKCKLLTDSPFIDPTIFRHSNKWWMFVSTPDNDVLNLYYSENLIIGWKPHRLNPVVHSNKTNSRPGGRVFNYNNKLYRLGQDCDPYYGIQLFAMEITRLTEDEYAEVQINKPPVLSKGNAAWNKAGMHHADLHQINNKWISFVDGLNKRTKKELLGK